MIFKIKPKIKLFGLNTCFLLSDLRSNFVTAHGLLPIQYKQIQYKKKIAPSKIQLFMLLFFWDYFFNPLNPYISVFEYGNKRHKTRKVQYYYIRYIHYKLYNVDCPIMIYMSYLMQYFSYQYTEDFNIHESRFRYATIHWGKLMRVIRDKGHSYYDQLYAYYNFCDGFMRMELDVKDTYLHSLFIYIIITFFEIVQQAYFTPWTLWHYLHYTFFEEQKKGKYENVPPIIPIAKLYKVKLYKKFYDDVKYRYIIYRFNQYMEFELVDSAPLQIQREVFDHPVK